MTRMQLLALGVFLAAVALRSTLLGAVAVLIGVSTIVATQWNRRVSRSLRIERKIATTLGWNEVAELEVLITNSSLLPVPWLAVEESIPSALRTGGVATQVLTLPAGETRSLRYPLRSSQRGYYRIGPMRLASGDVLGWQTQRMVIAPTAITVLPRIVPVMELGLPAALPFGPLASTRQRGEDPARPAGVRAYQASDGVRRIDWKATAHRNSLMVRRADPAISPETTFALAFATGDYPARVLHDALERAATTVASLAVALLARKLPVGLVASGFDPQHERTGLVLPLGKGDGQRRILLEALGRLQMAREGSLWNLLAQQPLPWGGTLVLVMSDLGPDELPHVLQLLRRGQQVALLLLEPTPGGLALAQQRRLAHWSVDARGSPKANHA